MCSSDLKGKVESIQAMALAGFTFFSHIDLARGIGAHQNNCQRGLSSIFAFKIGSIPLGSAENFFYKFFGFKNSSFHERKSSGNHGSGAMRRNLDRVIAVRSCLHSSMVFKVARAPAGTGQKYGGWGGGRQSSDSCSSLNRESNALHENLLSWK